MTSTEAIATRFFSPPESWYGARSARSGDLEHREHVGDPRLAPRRAAGRAAAGRTRPPRAPSARTPARRCSGRRTRRRERKPVENCSSSRWSSVTRLAERAGTRRRRGRAGRRGSSAASTCRSRWRRAARRVSPRATSSETPSRAGKRSRYEKRRSRGAEQRLRHRGHRRSMSDRDGGRGARRRVHSDVDGLERDASSVRASPRNPRATIAWCTSSRSACALPNSAPAVAPTNARPARPSRVARRSRAPCGPRTCRSTDVEQHEQVAVGHARARARTGAARPARAARRAAGPGRRQRQQQHQRDRGRDAGRDQRRRSVSPCSVSPTGAERSGTTMSPGVMKSNVAGSTMMPGEDRDEQPHALHEEAERQLRGRGERERQRVQRRAAPRRCGRARRRQQPDERDDLHARVEALEQPAPLGDVLGEDRRRHDVGGARDRLLARSCPCGGLPMQPHGHRPDLGSQQPVAGSRPPSLMSSPASRAPGRSVRERDGEAEHRNDRSRR